jgi:hypothetical protein
MTRKKLALAIQATVAVALVAVGMAAAGPSATTTVKFKAQLNNGQEVPHVKTAGGSGRFDATLTRNTTGGTLKWTLTFRKLSGKATAAHIHMGVKGKSGGILVSLCGPCKSPASGTSTVSKTQITAMLKGKTYVNVHTAKNPNGEIRGQITKAK